jgi:cysteinylglycine-S-conjugate dipeptidase
MSPTMTRGKDVADVIAALDAGFERTLEELVELARIPGVSADGFDPREVVRSAECAAGLAAKAGLENVEVIHHPGAHPYVLADWLHAEGAPTALIYAHHDVQPPGRPARWHSPAFEPTLREGRLYGRGVVDDKAGLMLHLAALRAWLDTAGGLPINVKLIVEGEEEIGSPHLEEFLRAHFERLRSDVIVLSDTANLVTGLPSLTTSLRGLVAIDVTVRALDHPIHSGMWGGPVLDAATALVRVLSRLVDDKGALSVPGLEDDVPAITPIERDRLKALPFDEEGFRSDAGMPGSARFTGDPASSVYERLWLRPSISVIAFESVELGKATNQLIDVARARVSVRVAPGQDPQRVQRVVAQHLRKDAPWGVEVVTEFDTASPGWRTEPVGPAFDAARRALSRGFGRDAVAIGCGGSIPFVGPFSETMGAAPALLLGLEDPICNAHGENESLCLEDFRKASRSAVYLLDELGRALR